MIAGTYRRSFHDEEVLCADPTLGMVHHGERDPGGYELVDGGDVVGVLYGALFGTPESFTRDLIQRILDNPERIIPMLDGSFALACLDRDANRFVLATDKLGTRSVYYTRDPPFVFGSELSSVLTAIEDPTVDEQSVSDLLTMIHIWGDRTLLEDVKSLRPATYVLAEKGERSVRRYWSFLFDSRPEAGYVEETAGAYADAVSASLETVPGTPGVWLSGGLDSRILVAALERAGTEYRTYTYDRAMDPKFDPFLDDIDIANSVADTLGVEHDIVGFTPETLAERLPELIEITDGQLGWNTLIHLSHVFEIDATNPMVLYEGPPLVTGEKVGKNHLGRADHPADVLSELHTRVDPKLVKETLSGDVEPKDTFINEVRAVDQTGSDEQIREVTHLVYNSRKHFSGSNKVARARVGTRVPISSKGLLDLVGVFPQSLRRGSIPLTGGRIPHVPSRMKLELMRELDGALNEIPYGATQLPPSYPHAAHGAGFVVKNAVQRLLSGSTVGEWYRENDCFREYLDELLYGAVERELFNAEPILEARRAHLQGDDDHIVYISAVTTVELFYRRILGQESA
ncbi:asparagine synthase [Halorubrum kocurii JCM 14978]|uniref:Asparagine synthase n=2 Tax=Halorubrum kocurii TaxID=478441 RepID=M0NIR2_9EURY|nr:asparagine synthase [Halorubrum kocurii JCM 14978]